MKERVKVIAHRLIWTVLLVACVLLTIYLQPLHEELVIVDTGCASSYDKELNKTTCDISITYNQEVTSGYATIEFYDESGTLLETKEEYFSGYSETVTSIYISVNGEADSYRIVASAMNMPGDDLFFMIKIYIGIVLGIFAFAFWIYSFLVNYKIYRVDRHVLLVYAGFYHHYIKVDGVIFDEHNTLIYLTPIKLSTTVERKEIEATISLTNRISVKQNNVLIRPVRKGAKNVQPPAPHIKDQEK